ncbi:MAG: HAD-IIIA family hydrolase [Elusimicrobiota bacterium]|jgi:D-glycero-D-manno-heptose 1,7-bisphosphate phosphatase|nr:HAD-IIIA family hydrolase [Elusimicrobiota bacterium]
MPAKAPLKAVLLDRDGTVIKEKPGVYLGDPEKVRLYKNTFAAFKLFKKAGYKIFIVSNQSGIGRGYFSAADAAAVNARAAALLKKAAPVEAFYLCPHAPQERCRCRKPAPQMGLQIISKYKIDPRKSFVVGDKKSDIDFGRALGMGAVLVLTANGGAQRAKYKQELRADKITRDLLGAAKYILRSEASSL